MVRFFLRQKNHLSTYKLQKDDRQEMVILKGSFMSGILLVVEDDVDVCEAIVDTLRVLPIKILTASDGQKALQIMRSQPIDAILSDINMPHMNGLDLLCQLRMLGLETPFVVLSAYGDRRNTVKSLQMGALDFLDKPFEVEHLLTIVNRALEIGIKTREIDHEIQTSIANKKMNPEEAHKIFQLQRELMVMRYDRKTYEMKKKAG